ncbi:ABC transporter ATP-binding protein [Bartonella queenslandensis]|uniref:ABC transporter ATP-binding protein n=1 Tax=Bartonella queenslandensis TaxID=481138 RepID=UPI0003058C1D|nr:ABC transporter ATP-binding protein [Bartonella queenslandensis]
MRDVFDTIAMIVWLLSLPIIITGIVFVCRKKWRKMGLKTLGVGILLFLSSAIVGGFIYKGKSDQVVHNNEVVTPSSTSSIDVATQDESLIQAPVENTDNQITSIPDNKSSKDDGLGFWGWFWLICFAFFALSIFAYWQDKRKKHFEKKAPEQVSVSPSHAHSSSDFSVLNKTSPALKNERLEKGIKIFLLCALLIGGIVAMISISPWLLVAIIIVLLLGIAVHFENKKVKLFEEQVAMLLPDIEITSFSEACEMFQQLNASEYDYRLARNEKLLGVQERVAFNINKKTTLFGRLLVTDQAIVFESPERNERTTWTRIASVTITYQGCQISRRTGVPWNYQFTAFSSPRFTAVIRSLGQPY